MNLWIFPEYMGKQIKEITHSTPKYSTISPKCQLNILSKDQVIALWNFKISQLTWINIPKFSERKRQVTYKESDISDISVTILEARRNRLDCLSKYGGKIIFILKPKRSSIVITKQILKPDFLVQIMPFNRCMILNKSNNLFEYQFLHLWSGVVVRVNEFTGVHMCKTSDTQ